MSTLRQHQAEDLARTPGDPLRQAAIERLEARREFWVHLTGYLLVNAVLVVVWFVVSGEGLFWPIFPIIGWGIGIVFHGLEVFRRPLSEDRIRREMHRLDPDRVAGD